MSWYLIIMQPCRKEFLSEKAMDNLNILIGSTYEQGFIRFRQFFKVYVQSSPEFKRLPTDIMNLYVKNDRDEMVSLFSIYDDEKKTQGPNEITRYNMYNSAAIRGLPAAGYTTADAIQAINETAAKTLPHGYKVAWEGLSYMMRHNVVMKRSMSSLLFWYSCIWFWRLSMKVS